MMNQKWKRMGWIGLALVVILASTLLLWADEGTNEENDGPDSGEVAINLGDAPLPVQQVLQKILDGRSLDGLVRERDEETVVFEADYQQDGHSCSVKVSADGQILEIESGIAASALPVPAMQALQATFPDARIRSADQVRMFGYEIRLKTGDTIREVKVSPTGDIERGQQDEKMERSEQDTGEENEEAEEGPESEEAVRKTAAEVTVALDDAPVPVRQTLQTVLAGQSLERLIRESDTGRMVFEAEYRTDGYPCSVKLTPEGQVLEIESGLATGKLPAAVSRTLRRSWPDARIEGADRVETRIYEVRLGLGKKTREVKVTAAGNVLPDEDRERD